MPPAAVPPAASRAGQIVALARSHCTQSVPGDERVRRVKAAEKRADASSRPQATRRA